MTEATKETSSRKARTVAKQTYALVEVIEDGDSFIYAPIPMPEGTDVSGRTPIMRAVKAAIAAGSDDYDDKRITVISFADPVLVKSEAVVVKRKVTFESV